jgi:tripeptide aminopeptidase
MAELCEIPSPSRNEAAVAAFVRSRLAALGADVIEDDAAAGIGCGCGNIVARFDGTAPGTPIVLGAHLDTVPQDGPIEVFLDDDGMLRNRHPTILGGDNKSAVATLLTALAEIIESGRQHAGIELLFTPCEEVGLLGASYFDPSTLRASLGFVFDHTGPVGDVVGSAPTLQKLNAMFVGVPAHAGISPEDGRSAIDAAARAIGRVPLGRIDDQTTANIGTISGGTATNVVSERCEITAEARSRDSERLASQVEAMIDGFTMAATDGEVDLELDLRTEFHGYTLNERAPQVAFAFDALRAVGYQPKLVSSGGGSDANALLTNGFPAVNLCNGMVAPHTSDECIAADDLDRMVAVVIALVDRAVTG